MEAIRIFRKTVVFPLAACFVCFSETSLLAESTPLKSGVYENLSIAVSPTGHVTGYYHEEQGEGVIKTCNFFLEGDAAARDGKITTWCLECYPGSIVQENGSLKLTIKLGRNHPGCGLVLLPEIEDGLHLERTIETHWEELRLISAEKAYFHSQTNESSRLSFFLVKGDVVGVISDNVQWIEIECLTKNKMTRGWIRKDQTAMLKPPQQ